MNAIKKKPGALNGFDSVSRKKVLIVLVGGNEI